MLDNLVHIIFILAILKSPDLLEMFKKMEIAIIKLMNKLEVIPEEVGRFM